MHRSLIVLCLMFYVCIVRSQTLLSNTEVCNSCSTELRVDFEATAFLKNNEYFKEFVDGYTGIGAFIKPTLSYYFNHNTKAKIGIFMKTYFGTNEVNDIIPVFRIQHQINNNLQVVFGDLFSTLNHNLEEPLFRYDRYYEDPIESGLQFLYKSNNFTSDLWVNWEKFIINGDPDQEEFTIGSTSLIKLFNIKSIEINTPVQLLMNHYGGQIDASSSRKSTNLNGVNGLQIVYNFNERQQFSFEPLLIWYQNWEFRHNDDPQNLRSGMAAYLKASYNSPNIYAMLGYWNARNFMAPKGEFLFHSISETNPNFVQRNRELLTSKITYRRSIGQQIKLETGFFTYYDMMISHFDYSFMFFLVLDESFFVTKVKRRLKD